MGYRVLISSLGRSHYAVAADKLAERGCDVRLIPGWAPSSESVLLKIVARIIGRKSFLSGMAKRRPVHLGGRIISVAWGELFQKMFFLTFGRFGQTWHHVIAIIGFHIHGLFTKRYVKQSDIFHVRSGSGRGGAISYAKKIGKKVLVDHCAAHPRSMYKMTGDRSYIASWSYWNSVVADCEDADLVMVGSEYVKETFDVAGFDISKIRVIPLGILPYFNFAKKDYPKSGTLRLIYTGAWQHWKGIADLVEAIRIMVSKGVDVQLKVVGGYSEDEPSYRKSVEFALPIEFVGHVAQERLKDYLAESDVFIFPSLGDGFAVSAIEGLASGVCLIATRESSIPIKDGETGYYVPAHSPESIADRVSYLNSHRDEIERVGRAGAAYAAENFTWDKYAECVEKVYEELLSK